MPAIARNYAIASQRVVSHAREDLVHAAHGLLQLDAAEFLSAAVIGRLHAADLALFLENRCKVSGRDHELLLMVIGKHSTTPKTRSSVMFKHESRKLVTSLLGLGLAGAVIVGLTGCDDLIASTADAVGAYASGGAYSSGGSYDPYTSDGHSSYGYDYSDTYTPYTYDSSAYDYYDTYGDYYTNDIYYEPSYSNNYGYDYSYYPD